MLAVYTGDADIENTLMDKGRGKERERVRYMERAAWMHIH